MRVSVNNSDPGYFDGSYRCTVYLDGVQLNDCVTADEEEGIAICYDLASPHRYGTDVPMVARRGEVRIDTRNVSGVCFFCHALPEHFHNNDCPRASPTTEYIYSRRHRGAIEREWKPGDNPVLPPMDERMFPNVGGEWEGGREPKRHSTAAAMMAARRARLRKATAQAEAEPLHRAISAMQKLGRAHEL